MNICLLGDFSQNLDEGYKNTSHYLAKWIEEAGNEVFRINVKRFGKVDFWRSLREAKPHIIHTIAQPTNASFIFTHWLRILYRGTRTVLSALRPEGYFTGWEIKPHQRILVRFTRPDMVLTQTPEAVTLFRQLGCSVTQMPNGVDLERFKPVTSRHKRQLREKYSLLLDQSIVLHVGHLEHDRNLMALEPLQPAGHQVLIAGSTCMGTNHELIQRLKNAGFNVLIGYQPKIEEFYMLADCYAFPVRPGNSLSLPLSILEAMACNLPVVSTRFWGLENYFKVGHGLVYVDDPAEIPYQVQKVIESKTPPATRGMVGEFAWPSITGRLLTRYQELLTP